MFTIVAEYMIIIICSQDIVTDNIIQWVEKGKKMEGRIQMIYQMAMKHRVLKTKGAQRVLKALEKSTKNGTQTLDMSSRDE